MTHVGVEVVFVQTLVSWFRKLYKQAQFHVVKNSCSTMFHCIILCHSTVARAFLHIVNWLRLGKCFGESHILYCIIIVSSDCVALQRTAAECTDTFMSDLISSERSHTEAINSGCDPRSTDKAPSVCITRATHANKV